MRRSAGGNPFEVRTVRIPQEPEIDIESFTESLTDSFLLFDEKLNCVSISPAGQRLLNMSEESAVGRNIVRVVPGASDPKVYEQYLNVMKRDERLATNAQDGDTVLDIKAFKVGDGLGIIASDTTQGKLSDNAVEDSQRHWQGMFNVLEDAALVIDREYNVENINDKGLDLLGMSREEVVGQKCYRLVCGLESPDELCPMRKALATGVAHSIDHQLLGKRYSLRVSPMMADNGEPTRFLETIRDATPPIEAAETGVRDRSAPLSVDDVALADIEGNLLEDLGSAVEPDPQKVKAQSAQEAADDRSVERELAVRNSALELSLSGVALAEPDGTLTYANRSFLRMWGLEDEPEVSGRPFAGLWQSAESAADVLAAVCSLGGWEGDLVALRKDGSTFDVELSACMVVDEDSGDLSMVMSIIDVTARKCAEQELEAQRKRLETREVEHAAELKYSDERLQQEAGGRRQAQEQLDELRGHIDELVEKRNSELTKANKQLEAGIAESKCAQDDLAGQCSKLRQTLEEKAAQLKKAREQLRREKAERRKLAAEAEKRGSPRKQATGEESGGQPDDLRTLEQELELRDSILAMLGDGIAVATTGGEITYVNDAFLTMWGCDSEEVLGKPLATVWAGKEESGEALKALEDRGEWQGESTGSRKDGTLFAVGVFAHVIRDDGDRPIRLVVRFVDLTERQETQQKLREFEDKFNALSVKLLEWAERLNGVLEDLEKPAEEPGEETIVEDTEAADADAANELQDDIVSEAETEAPSAADDTDATDADGPDEQAAPEAVEPATDQVAATVEIETATEDQGEAQEPVVTVESAGTDTPEAEAVDAAEGEASGSAEPGEAPPTNAGLVDIPIDDD